MLKTKNNNKDIGTTSLTYSFFLYSNVSTKYVKKQSVLTVPEVLRKLNKLKNVFDRSRYRHTLSQQ